MQGLIITRHFNPPAPCGAGPNLLSFSLFLSNFNPPAPCGAGLHAVQVVERKSKFQSTCPVRGRTTQLKQAFRGPDISIHLPRAGQDYVERGDAQGQPRFQSTCPVRGRTRTQLGNRAENQISIHLPRAGQDFRLAGRPGLLLPISIHLPRAGQDRTMAQRGRHARISIHLPRAGQDII